MPMHFPFYPIDRASGAGQIGAILRREGLYSSTLTDWRKARDAAATGALTPAKRDPKIVETNPLATALAAAPKENARLATKVCEEFAVGVHLRLDRVHPHHAKTSNPCIRTIASSFKAIPLGRLSPVSHFSTILSLVFRYRANTGWLT